jgi:hypothetical protein
MAASEGGNGTASTAPGGATFGAEVVTVDASNHTSITTEDRTVPVLVDCAELDEQWYVQAVRNIHAATIWGVGWNIIAVVGGVNRNSQIAQNTSFVVFAVFLAVMIYIFVGATLKGLDFKGHSACGCHILTGMRWFAGIVLVSECAQMLFRYLYDVRLDHSTGVVLFRNLDLNHFFFDCQPVLIDWGIMYVFLYSTIDHIRMEHKRTDGAAMLVEAAPKHDAVDNKTIDVCCWRDWGPQPEFSMPNRPNPIWE